MARSGSRSRTSIADEALIRSLLEQHGRAILGYAYRLLRDRQAAEDVVQEVLVRAWRHPEVLVNGKGSVRGWCLTVARNLVIDRQRSAAARPVEVREAEASVAAPGDHAEATTVSMTVMQALAELTPEHRAVIVEVYFKGSSVAEAAETLGVPTGTVRSRCYYALRALRPHVDSEGVLEGVPS